jgi:hypothetical protein
MDAFIPTKLTRRMIVSKRASLYDRYRDMVVDFRRDTQLAEVESGTVPEKSVPMHTHMVWKVFLLCNVSMSAAFHTYM